METLSTLTLEHFKQMQKLERQYYSDEYIAPFEAAYSWYLAYPLSTIAIAENDKIISFINMFPVKDHIFKQILSGSFNDKNLTLDCIEAVDNSKNTPLHMFLSCIVVDRNYRTQNTAQLLLKNAAQAYASISHRCDFIITDNVTAEGENFSQKYGFKKVCTSNHASQIYCQKYSEFTERVF